MDGEPDDATGDRDGSPDATDDWAGVVFDDDFVRAGRAEPTAQERAERAARIAREHGYRQGWRGDVPAWDVDPRTALEDERAGRRRTAGRRVLTGLVLLAVLAGAWFFRADVSNFSGTGPGAVAATPRPNRAPGEPLNTPPPAPDGSGGYQLIASQDDGSDRPVAWDPCHAIRYVVRTKGAPPGGERLLSEAIAEVSQATGLVFFDSGHTSEAPTPRRAVSHPGRYGGGFAPVLIAWSDSAESPRLAGKVAGVAGARYLSSDTRPGTRHYVTGQVVLDALDLRNIQRRSDGWAQARAVLMHELGHLVGLQHVPDRDQLMFAETTSRTRYGDGDKRGLNLLGRGRCF